MAEEWRRIVATLADDDRRRMYASIVLGVPIDLTEKKHDKAVAALAAAGLVRADGDGWVANGELFAELLAATPAVTKTGIDRFIRDGRIVQYPMRSGDRLEVLAWARDQALPHAGEVSEKEFGERLAKLTGDVASLRRYLVDAGLVTRDGAGSRYSRTG
jgi:hypothetical protein